MSAENLDEQFGLMSEEAVATLRGMKIASLRNERSRGGGPPFVKLNRNVTKYPVAGVKAFIAANTVDPNATAPTLIHSSRRRQPTA